MKQFSIHATRALALMGIVIATGSSCSIALAVDQSAVAPASDMHDRIVAEYLDGKWDAVEADLATLPKPPVITKASTQPTDVEYIRRTVAEGRPPWWKLCKAGKKTIFRYSVWGRSSAATFDPTAKTSIGLNYVNGQGTTTVMWDASEMDNPAEVEHGFTKGELNNLSVWSILGTCESWNAIPLRSQANLDDAGKLLLSRYLEFRGNVAGAYYGNPRARRWAMFLDLASYGDKYAKMPSIMSRKAIGAMFMEEVVAHRSTYPSIKLPESLPADAQAKLFNDLKSQVDERGFTFAEDRALREAIKTFALANELKVKQTGKVTLPSGLAVSLDPESDKPESARRDAWLVAHLK